jgi:ABC-2 type transport system permease protein
MDLTNLLKNPVLVFANTLFAAMLIIIMGLLAGGSYANMQDAYQYYLVSMLVFAMLDGAMTASNCFMERDIRRPNLRIIFSPAGSFSLWFSKIFSSFVFDWGLHLLLLAVLCPLLRVNLGSHPVAVILLMGPVEFASAALGGVFCCVLHSEESASSLLSTVITLLCIMGGPFSRRMAWDLPLRPFPGYPLCDGSTRDSLLWSATVAYAIHFLFLGWLRL